MTGHKRGSDAHAFDVLHERYEARLFRCFMRRTGDTTLARDLVQQVFLRVHTAREAYDATLSFRTWIFSIASNLLKDEYKRRGRRPGDLHWEETRLPRIHDDGLRSAEERLVVAERRRRILAALEALPLSQRRVVAMHKLEGASFVEIAQALGHSVEAVKSRAFRGYDAMRAKLEATVDDAGRRWATLATDPQGLRSLRGRRVSQSMNTDRIQHDV